MSSLAKYSRYNCDVCGSDSPIEIEVLRKYTDNQPIHVCKNCGFIYVVNRRTSKEIANVWSNEIFSDEKKFGFKEYSTKIPALVARQVFVAETVENFCHLKEKSLCDIGAGEGDFLKIIRDKFTSQVFGIEPSEKLCQLMSEDNIPNFNGPIEEYESNPESKKFDVITIMWTLEATSDPNLMIRVAKNLLKDNGSLVIATGSRILVPFKKPLQYYITSDEPDTHPSRFSLNTLTRLLNNHNLDLSFTNRYIDQDWLCVIAQKKRKSFSKKKDNYKKIIDFFEKWDIDSQKYK